MWSPNVRFTYYEIHIKNVIIILEKVCEHQRNLTMICRLTSHISSCRLPAENNSFAQSDRDPQTRVRSEKDTAVPDMAGFENKLGSYTLTQLNELLEDDEKLNRFIDDSEEVSFFFSWRASQSYRVRGELICFWNRTILYRSRPSLFLFLKMSCFRITRSLHVWGENCLNLNVCPRHFSLVCF